MHLVPVMMATRKIVGAKYNENLSAKDIAARLRGEIKAAVAAGELPAGRYSVRSGLSTHSYAIRVEAAVAGPYYNPARLLAERDEASDYGIPWMAPALRLVSDRLEAMLGAYNYDNSDSQSDYYDQHFYGSVSMLIPEGAKDAERAALPPKGSAEAFALRHGAPMLVCVHGGAMVPVAETALAANDGADVLYEALEASARAADRRDACPAAWTHEAGHGCDICC